MKVVVDASAAIEIVLDRKKAAQFESALSAADEVLVPDLFIAEVTNTIWKYHRFEGLELSSCQEALHAAARLPDTIVGSLELCTEVLHLALSARRPAHDMFYLVLARREGAALVTLDSSLSREAERHQVRVL